jgi:hypothetical protein
MCRAGFSPPPPTRDGGLKPALRSPDAMTLAPQNVFDGAHLRATLIRGRSDRLMVTFDWRVEGRAGFAPAHHSTAYARGGFSQLSIRTRANDWYVNPDTAALEATLARVARGFSRVQALGFSMGGYGALRFARSLGAAQVVAVSPQSSLKAPWDGRYRAEAEGWDAAGGDLAPRAAPGLGGLLAFDPFVAPDLRHARAILAHFPALRPVRLGFGGHPAIRTLRGAGGMALLLREAAAPRPSARAILNAHRAARRGSRGWWARLADHAERRRPALAAHARAVAAGLPPRPGDA